MALYIINALQYWFDYMSPTHPCTVPLRPSRSVVVYDFSVDFNIVKEIWARMHIWPFIRLAMETSLAKNKNAP